MSKNRAAIVMAAPAGWGKTHRLLGEMGKHILSLSPAERLRPRRWIVTPYAEQARRLRDLLAARLPGKLLIGDPVMGFDEFSRRLFPGSSQISEIKKRRLLEEILNRIQLDYFTEQAEAPGLNEALSGFVSEWKSSGCRAVDFKKAEHLAKSEPVFVKKLRDLERVFVAYQGRAEALGFQDFDDAYFERLADERPFEALKGIESIAFDGFFDFSPRELALLRRLMREVDELCVTLTHETGRREQLFSLTAGTLGKLESIGFKQCELPGPARPLAARSPALFAIERGLFLAEGSSTDAPGSVELYEAMGSSGEAAWMARRILRLMREDPTLHWSDIAILFRQVGAYAPLITEAFAELGIPVHVHERLRLSEDPWARHVLQYLRLLVGRLEPSEEVLAFLRSSFLGLPAGLASRFRHFVLRQAAYKRSGAPWLELAEAWLEEPALPERAVELKAFIERLVSLSEDFKKSPPAEMFQKVLNGAWQARERLDGFLRSGVELRSHKKLLEILTEIRINEAYFMEKPDAPSYLAMFEKGVAMTLFSVHTARADAVQVYSVSLARQKDFRVVFLGGLLQKNFPEEIREDPLLKDPERRLLGALGFEERLPKREHERYHFYLAVSRARERLFLSYPRFDLEGKESLPSFYLEELVRVFAPAVPVPKDSADPRTPALSAPDVAVNVRDLKNWLARELGLPRLASEHERAKEVLRSSLELLAARGMFAEFGEALASRDKDIHPPSALWKRFKPDKAFSPTALETYAACPLRYYASHVLMLKELPERETLPANLEGNLYHKALERLVPHLEKGPLAEDMIRLEARAALDANGEFQELLLPAEERELFQEIFTANILKFIRKEEERLAGCAFRPRLFEKRFPEKKDDEFWLEPGKIALRGCVDRADVKEATGEAFLIDYKTGGKDFNTRLIEEGLHLQLPLYGIALEELCGLKPVGYAIAAIKKNSFKTLTAEQELKKRNPLSPEGFAELKEQAKEAAIRYGRRILAGEFPLAPRECPDFCPFPAFCRFELWRRQYLEREEEPGGE